MHPLLKSHCFIEILYFMSQAEWIRLQQLSSLFYEKIVPQLTAKWSALIPVKRWLYASHVDEGYICRVQLISPRSSSYLQKLPWPEPDDDERRALTFVTTEGCLTDARNRRHGTRTFAWSEKAIYEVIEPTLGQYQFFKKLSSQPLGVFVLNLVDLDNI